MENKTIVFMGTPIISKEYLKKLIESKIKIRAVITQPPKRHSRGLKLLKSSVHEFADENKIDVYTPQTLDLVSLNYLNKIKPDLIIVMAYGKILPKAILELPKYGCINVHLSILPRWRGAAPIEHTLMNGDEVTGISIIKMIEKLDAGPIISQKKITVPSHFNKKKLSDLLTIVGSELLVSIIPKIINNQFQLIDQDEDKVTYAHKITSELRKINFNNTSKNIINNIRAHSPYPGSWFELNNERIKIIEAKIGSAKGNVSTILNNKFEIASLDGSIEPVILQREGKKIVTKDEFLRGFKLNINEIINA